jgi:hypothetical protein
VQFTRRGGQVSLTRKNTTPSFNNLTSGCIISDDFYHFTDQLLAKFKRFQGLNHVLEFPGTRLEQAALIWRQTPRGLLNAILKANGASLPPAFYSR